MEYSAPGVMKAVRDAERQTFGTVAGGDASNATLAEWSESCSATERFPSPSYS